LDRWGDQLAQTCHRLSDQLARYRELFEFAPDPYLLTDPHGVIAEANQAAAGFFRAPREFLVGKPLPFLVAREDRGAFYARLVELMRQKETSAAWEMSLQPHRGPARHVAISAVATPGEDGEAPRLRWLIRDVTARREAEEGLRQEKRFTENLLEAGEALIVLAEADGRLRRVNVYTEEVTGYLRSELLGGLRWESLVAEEDRVRAAEDAVRGRAAGGKWRGAYRLRTRGGASRWVQWSFRTLGIPGEPPGVLAVGQDVTELHDAQEKALQSERLASIGRMAAGLAHESRNALQRSAACLTRLRWQCENNPQALDLIARLEAAQADLLRQYEDVREYAVPIRLECRPCELSEVWREVWDNLATRHPGRGQRLDEVAGGVDLRLRADRFRLAQVFRNLFENALEAAPGAVRVEVACADVLLAGRPALRVAVRDDGPGLDAEQRRRLFEPFFTTKTRGSGLGMAIVKRIVEAHLGTVELGPPPADGEKTGAEIILTLPRSQP
jgi:PAS domain S-box-containing protein